MYIENSDAREYLKTLHDSSVDMVLTDPPYIISKYSGFKYIGKKGLDRLRITTDYGEWDNVNIEEHNHMLLEVFMECHRVLKDGGSIIVWYDLWKIGEIKEILSMSGKKFKSFRFIEWLKDNPVPINSKVTYLSNAREVAVSAVKTGKSLFKREYHNGVFNFPIHRDGGKRIHPTQKPLNLMKELIDIHTNEGDVVLDPFSGSGTTVLAALLMNRKGLGCELDSGYCKKANTRIINEVGDVFLKPVWEF